MSKSNWCNGLALGLILGGAIAIVSIVWIIGLNYCPESPCKYQHSNQADPTNNENWLPNSFWPDITTDPHPADQNDHPDYYEHQDLAAQEIMAEATKWIVILTAVSMLLGLFGAVAIFWTLLETRKLTKDTREIGEVQTRAYLTPSVIRKFVRKPKDGATAITIQLTIENKGITPANNVKHETSMGFRHQPITGDAVFHEMHPLTLDLTSLGSGAISKGIIHSINTFELEEIKSGRMFCYIWGIATYDDAFPKSPRRTTRHAYELRVDPEDLEGPGINAFVFGGKENNYSN